MDVKGYWQIFKRRWLIALIPVALVAIITLATYQTPPTVYNTGVRFIVGQAPSPDADNEDEERYYAWLTSEYVVNVLTDWVRGNQFATAVSAELAGQGMEVAPAEIGLAADNTRSMLQLSINHGDPARLEAIMAATITVLTEQAHLASPILADEPPLFVQLDEPTVNPISAGLSSQLALPLRLGLALFAGVMLALLVDYVDPRIYGRETIEQLELELLGEIPK